MSRLRHNIISNYAGQIWIALINVVFVPLYIHMLGIEAFGLIAFMLGLQSLAQLFDFGIGGSINREIARRSQTRQQMETIHDLVRTFEWFIWPISLLIFAGIWLASSFIAVHWLHPQQLSREATTHAVILMGAAIATLWPNNFYANGLSGLERQPVLNLINALFATLRSVGVIPILYWVSPTITAFFFWYAAMGICQSLAIATTLWNFLPDRQHRPAFRHAEVLAGWRFAGGLFAIAALSLSLSQVDRFTLSAMRPLVELGYYGVALSVTAGLGRMVVPMFNALYPRFSRLVASNDETRLRELYHLSNQFLAVLIAAIASILIVFSKDVLYIWTGDKLIAAKVAIPLSILVAGTALNGLLHPPYALQLANGWTKLAIGGNMVALLLGIPFTLWAVTTHGITGAACLWFGVNLGYILIQIPIMHRRLLREEMWHWYLRDILPPFIASAAVALVFRSLNPSLTRDWKGLLLLACISATTLCAAALSSSGVRSTGFGYLSKYRAARAK